MRSIGGDRAIIIGDSFNNTLGLIRSLGEAKIPQKLILVGPDRLRVAKSRYLCEDDVYRVAGISDCVSLLLKLADNTSKQVIFCTNDRAATFVDENEDILSQDYITPMRGKRLGEYMNKKKQCELAAECGFDVPVSAIYRKGEIFPESIPFPLLLKPLVSIQGEKSDIHICHNRTELQDALKPESECEEYVVQEYIEKEFEINLIGVSTDRGIVLPGGIRKIRHYPTIYSPCSYGVYQSIEKLGFDASVVQRFMGRVGYRGPFSVELLHKGSKNYFMEVNFRNDGLAYAATAAGVNLSGIYMQFDGIPADITVKETYMMDLSIDFCHYKDGNISLRKWLADFIKTSCQLNFNWKDPAPTLYYYLDKFKRKICR